MHDDLPIGILPSVVGVIPIRAWLVDLNLVVSRMYPKLRHQLSEELAWKLCVKVSPGPIGHCTTPVGPSIEFVPFWKIP